jgi:hypothetical protein
MDRLELALANGMVSTNFMARQTTASVSAAMSRFFMVCCCNPKYAAREIQPKSVEQTGSAKTAPRSL